MLTDGQRRIIGLLIELARAADRALDDSEESIGDDGRFHAINGPDFDELSDALEKLEELPDDKPGETLGAGGKAEWALRSILASAAPAEGREPTGDELRKLVREIRDASGGPSDAPQPADYVLGGWRAAIATAPTMSEAARDVLAERWRQVTAEGWTPEHDDEHSGEEMALAAIAYAESAVGYHIECPDTWPWSPKWWKPTTPRRDLVKAGALILAEIERIDRAAAKGRSE